MVMNRLKIPSREVLDAAATKPYGFMKFEPGIGVGGHCIPVDPVYLSFMAKENNCETKMIDLAAHINLNMPLYTISKIEARIAKTLVGSKVLICGVSYKPNIADYRESPSVMMLREMIVRGIDAYYYDPLISNIGDFESNYKSNIEYDYSIIAVDQKTFDFDWIKKNSKKVFDLTGKHLDFEQII
jgi:UDP-N-acetyl-D-glucosamine dehydrogenase